MCVCMKEKDITLCFVPAQRVAATFWWKKPQRVGVGIMIKKESHKRARVRSYFILPVSMCFVRLCYLPLEWTTHIHIDTYTPQTCSFLSHLFIVPRAEKEELNLTDRQKNETDAFRGGQVSGTIDEVAQRHPANPNLWLVVGSAIS